MYFLVCCVQVFSVCKLFFSSRSARPPEGVWNHSETALKPQKFNTCRATSQYYFPVLLCTTKLAQSTSQYYFVLQSLHSTSQLAQTTSQYYCVLQSLHKALPSTTVYYFPKLAQTTSQYYFVLHGLHKLLPSTTVYYKACTNYFPVLLCTTKLAQTTSQYYFVLQSLHKLLPSTTVYYKACTNYFPVRNTKWILNI